MMGISWRNNVCSRQVIETMIPKVNLDTIRQHHEDPYVRLPYISINVRYILAGPKNHLFNAVATTISLNIYIYFEIKVSFVAGAPTESAAVTFIALLYIKITTQGKESIPQVSNFSTIEEDLNARMISQ